MSLNITLTPTALADPAIMADLALRGAILAVIDGPKPQIPVWRACHPCRQAKRQCKHKHAMLLPLKAAGPDASLRPIEGYPLAPPPYGRQPKPRPPAVRRVRKVKVVDPDALKKKRGRPTGSKNRNPRKRRRVDSDGEDEDEDEEDEEEEKEGEEEEKEEEEREETDIVVEDEPEDDEEEWESGDETEVDNLEGVELETDPEEMELEAGNEEVELENEETGATEGEVETAAGNIQPATTALAPEPEEDQPEVDSDGFCDTIVLTRKFLPPRMQKILELLRPIKSPTQPQPKPQPPPPPPKPTTNEEIQETPSPQLYATTAKFSPPPIALNDESSDEDYAPSPAFPPRTPAAAPEMNTCTRQSSLEPPLESTPLRRAKTRPSASRQKPGHSHVRRPISPSFLDVFANQKTPVSARSSVRRASKMRKASPGGASLVGSVRAGSISITPPPGDSGSGDDDMLSSPVVEAPASFSVSSDDYDDGDIIHPSSRKVDSVQFDPPSPPREDTMFGFSPPTFSPAPGSYSSVRLSPIPSSTDEQPTSPTPSENPFQRRYPPLRKQDPFEGLSRARKAAIAKWKDPARTPTSRFSGPRVYTALTNDLPMRDCGLVVLPPRLREREKSGKVGGSGGWVMHGKGASPEL